MSKGIRYNNNLCRLIMNIFAKEREIKIAVQNYKFAGERNNTPSVRGIVSNPTESLALRRVCEPCEVILNSGEVIKKPEQWLRVIDATYKSLRDDDERNILRAKVRGIYYVKVCAKYNISHSAFYDIVNKSYNFALAAACQLGLIKVI